MCDVCVRTPPRKETAQHPPHTQSKGGKTIKMKTAFCFAAVVASATAFAPATTKSAAG